MTSLYFALAGLAFGALLTWAIMVATTGRRIDAAANERATEREARVRAEAEQRIADLRASQAALRDQFTSLAAEVLDKSTKTLMETAEERFKRAQQAQDAELAKREASVKQLVEPMAKALDEVKRQTSEADKMRAQGQAALSEQIKQMMDTSKLLGKETSSLRSALRRPEVRGRWGELHLRRVVELAGLVSQVDFDEQTTSTDSEGNRLRPDMVVHLAGGRTIVVDAKTPLDALLEADDDPDNRDAHLLRHAANVRKRVQELKSKAYTSQYDQDVEFVVLFLPAESFLQVALERDPQLQEWAYEQGVIVATPTILVAMLRTVAHAWKQDALAKNARQVLATGKELVERLSKMGEHLGRVGKSIESASKAYNETVGAFERRVLPTARRFGQLQHLGDGMDLPPIDTETRAITAPELSTGDEDDGQPPAP
jgi:DNA recombination protein RmuC